MNQSKRNDPRVWGKIAVSGGVPEASLSDVAFHNKWVAMIAQTKLTKGEKVCRPKGANGFRSIRKIKDEHVYMLGCELTRH